MHLADDGEWWIDWNNNYIKFPIDAQAAMMDDLLIQVHVETIEAMNKIFELARTRPGDVLYRIIELTTHEINHPKGYYQG